MPILDELKKKANGKADSANNIAEAIAQMNFSEGDVTPEEIAESVSAYLDEHLTNPTNPPIDTSLTIAGAAADSKETGDKITQLKEELSRNINGVLNGEVGLDVEWEDGGFYTSTGLKNVSTSAAYAYSNRTVNMFKGDGRTYTINMSGSGRPALQIFGYDSSKTYAGLIRTITGSGVTATFENNKYYNLAFIDLNSVERPSLSNLSIEASMELNYVPSIIKEDYVSLLASKESTDNARSVREVDTYDILALCTLERGGINEGEDVAHSYRIRTKGFVNAEDVTTLSCIMQSGYVLYIYGFDSTKTFTGVLGNYLQNAKTVDVSSASYIRMMFMKTSGLLPFEDISNYNIRASYILRERLNALDCSANIPSYWKTYLPSKIDEINADMDACALSGDGFVFITDYHVENNVGLSHYLAKYITENTSVINVVFGGDILNGSTTKEDAYNKIKAVSDRFSIIDRLFFLRGNHDFNLNDGGSQAEHIEDSEVYNLIMKRCEHLVKGTPNNLYYYRDNEKQHIRYIYLDSRYENSTDPIDDNQLTWMKARIAELDSTWSVIVLTHELFGTDETSYDASGTKIVNALNEVKATASATIPCVIAGHTHKDISKVDNGTVMIGTGCDTMQSYTSGTRTRGTTTEQLFDVFAIDTNSRTIKATRIGYGANRSWTY